MPSMPPARSLREARYLSVGGGFVVTAGAPNTQVIAAHDQLPLPVPHRPRTAWI